mmetsp:Transcript_38237/g.79909  ORF Transcript_38237/g.79909 Transcript_38237/m.79909 type:complete len:227 (-) Transcript_38237:1879-2559(-)
MKIPSALQPSRVTLVGYGALLSEPSSRLTFPHLTNFRHVRIKGMRRVFAHPHIFLLGEGIADFPNTLKIASLSVEPAPPDVGLVVAAFEVALDDSQREAFLRREPEYKIDTTPFYALDDYGEGAEALGEGVICLASEDEDVEDLARPDGIETIWNWPRDSGLLPFSMYLRHCLLAVEKAGGSAHDSFLNDTYLVDRKTTIAKYLEKHGEEVMSSLPPEHLANRFSG